MMVKYGLITLICEKIIQHTLVSIAFWFNAGDIRWKVAANPDTLLILGAVVAVLFVVSLWGIITNEKWVPTLLIALALFDIGGEFLAQGKLAITITLSFVLAILILILAPVYRRHIRQKMI